jgi:hypothetical protein
VDNGRASSLLESEWNNIQRSDETDYVNDYIIRTKIREVLNASQLTYKYILFTGILSKATNPNIHYRCMQAKSSLPGAYDARSVGHGVVVPWEKAHGERLGGSNEPFLNKPARDPEFDTSNAARYVDKQERLANLLDRLEERVNSGDLDPVNVLRQFLYEYSCLESRTLEYTAVSDVPATVLISHVHDYIKHSGGGERLSAVTAGVMQAYYAHAHEDGPWVVDAEHANAPDNQSNAAGDVEILHNNDLHRAIEVKDKPTEPSDIQHAIKKARENSLPEYFYVVGAGYRGDSRKEAFSIAQNAPVEIGVLEPADLLSMLRFVGEDGRKEFLESTTNCLNQMRATQSNKDAFGALSDRFRDQ